MRQMLAIGGDQLDVHFHGAILAQSIECHFEAKG
jgi:hypothetical protein